MKPPRFQLTSSNPTINCHTWLALPPTRVLAISDLAPGGLAINQLLKLKAKGLITTQQFLDMTADLEGSVEERPVVLSLDVARSWGCGLEGGGGQGKAGWAL